MPVRVDTSQLSFYGPVFPSTIAKGDRVLEAASRAGHQVTRIYGYNSTPDHCYLQSVDLMYYGDTRMRDWLCQYLIDNAKELGVMGIISNRRCMGFPDNETDRDDCEVYWNGPEGQWRYYGGPDPHTDHIHVQFNTAPIKGGQSQDKPDAVAKPDKGGWEGVLHVVRGTVMAYDGSGRKRPEHKLRKGDSVRGQVDKDPFGDGRYFCVGEKPHRLWYPLDDRNFAHTPKGEPIPQQRKVSLRKVVKAARRDPKRRQGGTTRGCETDVRIVEAALKAEGLLPKRWAKDASYGTSTKDAYGEWQRRCGYTRPQDCNGIPGPASLKKLGAKYDFKVVK